MRKIIHGLAYDTETATLVAHDRYWDGRNWDRGGRNTYLYRTPRGRWFVVTETRWEGERDSLVPIEVSEAKEYYEGLPEHELDYEEAFGVAPEPA